MSASQPAPRCDRCAHFDGDNASIEAQVPGLTVMGSGHASVRSSDGVCHKHQRYLSFDRSCADFVPASAARAEPVSRPRTMGH